MESKLKLSPPKNLIDDKNKGSPLLKWLYSLYSRLGEGPFMVRGYAKANLPSATNWGDNSTFSSLIYVSDEIGGAVIAYSDGTNWRRVTDRSIVA